jgi:hypothetical protein
MGSLVRGVKAAPLVLALAGCSQETGSQAASRLDVDQVDSARGSGSAVAGTPPPPPVGEVLLAVGDVAQCRSSNDEATAAVVSGLAGTVALLGDVVYENGSTAEFRNCFHPSWGELRERTRPVAGNHEYRTSGAASYYAYFGAAAGEPGKGYYSYDLGDWHIIALNSNCSIVSCAAGSPQETWLRADLAATTKSCVLAYWHHPRFSSGSDHGNSSSVAPFWNALHAAGAEIVLNGHEHLYERFAPQTPQGAADPANGIRQFTVGTGGRGLDPWGRIKRNSEVRNNVAHGVLRLTLGAGTYAWEFKPVAGRTFSDTGTGSCH